MQSGSVTPLPTIPVLGRSSSYTPSNLGPGTPSASTPPVPSKTKICVYCGASPGTKPEHMAAARELAEAMAAHDIGLVYGGGTVGLMGELAKTLVALKGPEAVHGIIPEALVKYERDLTHGSIQSSGGRPGSGYGTGSAGKNAPIALPEEKIFGKTTVVKDMHTRKQMMAQEVLAGGPGSGFIALSGGYGTLEELLETCTWNQLGIHSKGVCVLNVDGFYDGIIEWINKSVTAGFIRPANANILVSATTAEEAVRALRDYQVSGAQMKLTWDTS